MIVRHIRDKRRVMRITYWKSIELGITFLRQNREDFLKLAAMLGRGDDDIKTDYFSVHDQIDRNMMKHLRAKRYKKPGDETMQTRQEKVAAKHAAAEKYWQAISDYKEGDGLSAVALCKAAKLADRSPEDITRDLQNIVN